MVLDFIQKLSEKGFRVDLVHCVFAAHDFPESTPGLVTLEGRVDEAPRIKLLIWWNFSRLSRSLRLPPRGTAADKKLLSSMRVSWVSKRCAHRFVNTMMFPTDQSTRRPLSL